MFPPVPTDNLYKFAAFAGVLVVIGAGYMYETRRYELKKRCMAAADHYLDACAEYEVQFAVSLPPEIDNDIIDGPKWIKEKPKDDKLTTFEKYQKHTYQLASLTGDQKKELWRALYEADERVAKKIRDTATKESDRERLTTLRKKLRELGSEVLLLWNESNEVSGVLHVAPWVTVLGFVTFAFGIGWWRSTLQKPTNELLKHQVEKEEVDVKLKKADLGLRHIQTQREKLKLDTDVKDDQLKKVQLELETLKLQNEKKRIALEKTNAAMPPDANGSTVQSPSGTS